MAVDYVTLPSGRKMDNTSTLVPSQNLEVFTFGEGVSAVYSLKPITHTFTIVYQALDRADFNALRDFYYQNQPLGTTIRIAKLPFDPSGNTFGYFYLSSIQYDGSFAPNVTITAVETLIDA